MKCEWNEACIWGALWAAAEICPACYNYDVLALCGTDLTSWEHWVSRGSQCNCGNTDLSRMAKSIFGEIRDYPGADKMRLILAKSITSSPLIWSVP